ncbi:MAG: 3-phosphoserine/phosphohydroxythreonine transaminase [Planctomycetota bacterium]|nr:3-phosphoserine/phosphohydroxythreonine transaminase [Planctomycetota bacterium]
MSERIFNFSAGPGCLAEEVLQQIRQDVWNIAGSGIGILEHSHRGKVFDKVLEEAEADMREVASIPKNYKVLFLTGGATTQNFMVPANMLPEGGTADYLVTGYWAEKSAEEAKFYGNVHEAASSKGANHSYIPSDSELKYSARPAYVHYTSNNTIYGTEFHRIPACPEGVPLVCDMSSDFVSRPCDISKFGLIYAGAQKNVGPAGTTVVIIRDDLLEPKRPLPTMLKYAVHAKDGSRHNTPPAFSIYAVGVVLKWMKKMGGVKHFETYNKEKAGLIYGVLDQSKFYKGHARADSRSLMNITFRTPSAELDDLFCKEAGKHGMDGLKGHRATGGMRASTYNAFPREGCVALAQFMRDFEKKHG